jgi:hypothetical protein
MGGEGVFAQVQAKIRGKSPILLNLGANPSQASRNGNSGSKVNISESVMCISLCVKGLDFVEGPGWGHELRALPVKILSKTVLAAGNCPICQEAQDLSYLMGA